MEVYNCKILLGGSRDNEVRKRYITAAEIAVLRHIHGDDSVLDLVHVGTCKIHNAQVRELLGMTYGSDDLSAQGGPRVLKDVFGPASAPLPLEIEGVKLRTKPTTIPVEEITRWREAKPPEDVRADEPSFAD